MNFNPYPKIHALGTKGFERIFEVPVEISEKIDGSNVSIHKLNGEIKLASRSRWLDWQSPNDQGMFSPFITWGKKRLDVFLHCLPQGSVLWGEFSNNHNVLKYEKTYPFILFDISVADEFGNRQFLPRKEWNAFFSYYFGSDDFLYGDLNPVQYLPIPFKDNVISQLSLEHLLTWQSMLGGKIEGVVIKNYTETGPYGQPLFCKYVAPEFKEKMQTRKHLDNQTSIEQQIAEYYYNEARLNKGIGKLKELGKWTGTVKDIGPLIGVINQDVYTECEQDIKQDLFDHFWKQIARIITSRIPQNYKDKLNET